MALTTSEFIHKFEGLNRMNLCLTKKKMMDGGEGNQEIIVRR